MHGERERAGRVTRRGGEGCWGLSPQVAGQPGPLPLARERTGRGPLPAAPMPRTRPQQHPAVTRRGSCAPRAGRAGRLAPGAPVAGRKITAPGRNAAHCPGRPLQRQGRSRSAASPGDGRKRPPLTPETSASPAGLTARARPEARPESARRTSTNQLQRKTSTVMAATTAAPTCESCMYSSPIPPATISRSRALVVRKSSPGSRGSLSPDGGRTGSM